MPDDIAPTQRLVAHATHWGLYALLIVQPIAGWIATSAYRAPITVFGLFELPPIWPENRAFSEQLFFVHTVLGIAIACLVAHWVTALLILAMTPMRGYVAIGTSRRFVMTHQFGRY